MEIIWLPLAEHSLENIFSFYKEKSLKVAKNNFGYIIFSQSSFKLSGNGSY